MLLPGLPTAHTPIVEADDQWPRRGESPSVHTLLCYFKFAHDYTHADQQDFQRGENCFTVVSVDCRSHTNLLTLLNRGKLCNVTLTLAEMSFSVRPHQNNNHTGWSSLLPHIFTFLVKWRPLVATVIITSAKEEIRQSRIKWIKNKHRTFTQERLLFLSDVKSKVSVGNRVIYIMLSMFITVVK